MVLRKTVVSLLTAVSVVVAGWLVGVVPAQAAGVTTLSSPVPGIAQIVAAATSEIRNGPADTYDQIGLLEPGEQITVTGYTTDGWLEVETPEISIGYVMESDVQVPVVSVSTAHDTVSLAVGATEMTGYTVFPECASNQGVSWSSSEEAVATVDDYGDVTGLTAGTTVVTVTTADGAFQASTTYMVTGSVTVSVAATGVTITKGQPMMAGRTQQLTASAVPSTAAASGYTWSSKPSTVATVSSAGLVTGQAAGKGKSANATVTVTMADGAHSAATTFKVYTVKDVQARLVKLKCRSSSNKTLVIDGIFGTMSKSALKKFQAVSALAQNGTPNAATLKKLFSSTAKVCGSRIPVTGVSITTGKPMMSGRTQQLTGKVAPSNATTRSVTWHASNSAAKVSSRGLVTGKITGTGKSANVTITVKTNSGAKTAATKFKVYTVQDVQAKLNALICRDSSNAVLAVNGVFGTKPAAALKKFQTANGMKATGTPDSTTIAKLFAAGALPCATVALALSGGMTVPGTIYAGTPVTVMGTITSNSAITNVHAVIATKAGTAKYTCSATPKAKSYNLGACDSILLFSKLTAGDYVYTVKATDATVTDKQLTNQAFTVKNVTVPIVPSAEIQKMLNNLGKSSKIPASRLPGVLATSKAMLEAGFQPAFVAGMLANICYEGNPGQFESSNYITNPEPGYLLNIDKYYNYRSLYSGQYLYAKNVTTVASMVTSLNNVGWKASDGTRMGFGLGSVQWTFQRTYTLMQEYLKANGGKSTITQAQVITAESQMILNELSSKAYSSIRSSWMTANAANMSSQAAAYDAASRLCINYEAPANASSAAVTRGNLAKQIYADMVA